jgi:hypothetical protein
MVGITALWLPILLSSVFVFILSSIIHMFTKWHSCHRYFCGVRCRTRFTRRRPVPAGFSFCGNHRVRRVFRCVVADVNLVAQKVEHNLQGDGGRTHLRTRNGGNVWMAVAAYVEFLN